MSLWEALLAALKQAWRQSDKYTPLLVFALIGLLFPLALGARPQLLTMTAPGILWVALVLAVIFSLEGLFRSDYQDGSLALWALQPSGLARYALMRLLAIWAVQLLPLMLVSPLMALAFGLNLQALPVLFLTELLALPILLLVGASLSALTLTARSAGLLNALLALPFFLPVLIFAASALERAQEGLAVAGPLYLLASVLCLTLVLAPWAIQASLRLSVRRG